MKKIIYIIFAVGMVQSVYGVSSSEIESVVRQVGQVAFVKAIEERLDQINSKIQGLQKRSNVCIEDVEGLLSQIFSEQELMRLCNDLPAGDKGDRLKFIDKLLDDVYPLFSSTTDL